MTPTTPLGAAHRPQLDALRAFAVLAVMSSHFWEALPSLGNEAVRLFFVLSGFLITSNLLDGRTALGAGASRRDRWLLIGRFAARRGLRIFPAYYLLLVVLATFNAPGVRHDLAVFAVYLSNFHFAARNDWDPWPLSHAWSLAIEEQFYLVWPMVALFVPLRRLAPLALLLIGLAVPYRALLAAASTLPEPPIAVVVMPPGNFDSLGLGVLLALWRERRHARRWLRNAGVAAFAVWLPCRLSMEVGWLDGRSSVYIGWMPLLWSLAACTAVDAAARGLPGPVGAVLDNRVLRYLGRISYGMYLYHPLALWMLLALPPRFGLPGVANGPGMLLLGSALTIAVAAVSWHAFEAPLNRLKRLFPYRSEPDAHGPSLSRH